MKVAFPIAAAVRSLIVPLAGAVALASACSAAPVPRHEAHAVSQLSRRTGTPPASGRVAPRAARKDAPRSATGSAGGPAANRASAGMVIGIDPESGLVGPVAPGQMARLSAAMRARQATASQRSAPVHHADGRVSMYVGDWMKEYAVVRLGANGRPVYGCVDGRDPTARLDHPHPAAPGPEER